jgi:hypothetical protein
MNPDGSELRLYNLKADPTESDNVAVQYPDVSEPLRKKVLEWFSTLPNRDIPTVKERTRYENILGGQ